MKIITIIIISLIPSVLFSQDFWVQTNGPFGGNVICITYQSNGNVYCGTNYGGGVYKSTNNGLNWTRVYTAIPENVVFSLAVDSNNNIYAGGNTVYKSTDNGVTWSLIGNNMYGSIKSLAVASNGYIFAGSSSGVYRSTNNGTNWSLVSSAFGYTAQNITIAPNGYIYAALLYAWIRKSTDYGNTWSDIMGIGGGSDMTYDIYGNVLVANNNGIYKSSNSGLNWQWINNTTHMWSVGVRNGTEYLAGSMDNRIFKSTNNGLNWNVVYNTQIAGNINDIMCKPDGIIFTAASYNGIYVSLNGGLNWNEANSGITNQNITDLIFDGNTKIYCSTVNDGLFVTSNGGNTWMRTGLDYKYISALCSIGNNTLLAFTVDSHKLYRSTNSGLSWQVAVDSLPLNSIYTFVSSNNDIFAGTNDGIYKSSNLGSNWSLIALAGSPVPRMVKHANILFAITDSAFYRSINNGTNWIRMAGFQQLLNDMTFSNFDNNIYVTKAGSFYRSTDGGFNWLQINSTMGFGNIICNNSGVIFGSKYGGVFRSDDSGHTWVDINSGLFNSHAGKMVIDNNGFLLVSTQGSGVFRSAHSVISVKPISTVVPESFSLHQNYPNPFNPTTKIKFEVSKLSKVKLIIYDVLGREIATLVNEQLKPGFYEIEWNGTKYASGIYFYKLITKDFTETKKMVLIK